MRWGCLWLLVAVGVSLVGLGFGVFGRAVHLNDRIVARYAAALYEYPLPPQSEVVARNAGVGLFFGNGNHCDISVVQLLRTHLSVDDVERYYRRTDIAQRLDREDDRPARWTVREIEPGEIADGRLDLWEPLAQRPQAPIPEAGRTSGDEEPKLVKVLLVRNGSVFRDHEAFDPRCH